MNPPLASIFIQRFFNPIRETERFKPVSITKNGDSYIRLEGGFDLKTGPKVELGVSMAKILKASVSGWAGIEIDGTATGLRYEAGAATASEVHACDLCVDMTASLFAEFEGMLGYEITEKIKDDLISIKLLSGHWDWSKSFFSVDNEAESIYGGEMTWQAGECKNKNTALISTLGIWKTRR